MRHKLSVLFILFALLISCKKNKDCQNCRYVSREDASFIFTIDSFAKHESRDNWCSFTDRFDTIQFTDASGVPIAEGIKECN